MKRFALALLATAALAAPAFALDTPDVAAWRASYDAGVKAKKACQPTVAIEQLTAAVNTAETLGAQDDRLGQSLNDLGFALGQAFKLDEAKAAHERALRIAESVHGKDSKEAGVAVYGLALVAGDQNRPDDAEDLFKRALAICEQTFGPHSPEVARTLYGYGYFKVGQQDYGQARTLLARALDIYDRNGGDDGDTRALTLLSLAGIYAQQNKNAEAAEAYGRALDEGEKALPSDHPTLAWIRVNVAEFKYGSQDVDGAAKLFEQSIPVLERSEFKDEQQLAGAKADLADVYVAQKKPVEAEKLYAEALPVIEKALPNDDPILKQTQDNYAKLKTYNMEHAGGTVPKCETRYVNGTAFQVATQGDLQVWMACWKGSEVQAMLYVVNGSDHAITFFPDQVQVEALKKDGQRSPLKTFSADQYERKVSNANAFKAFAIAFGQSGQNQPQPRTTNVSGTYNVNSYGSGQSEYGSYSGTITRWPTQADYADAEARNNARTEAMVSQLSTSFRTISATLMRTQTLDAHSYYGGVVCMNQSGKNYVMTVPFGGSAFQFSFAFN